MALAAPETSGFQHLLSAGEEVPAAAVPVGARVLVAPGQRVPADGVVAAGASAADESMLTGEAAPVDKGVGDAMLGGTVNAGDATLEVGMRCSCGANGF